MKVLLTNILLLLSAIVFGQVQPDSIEIRYIHGFYPFDKIGKYFTIEKLEIKKLNNGEFQILEYTLTEKYAQRNDSVKIKTQVREFNDIIDSTLIKNLIIQLKTDRYPLTSQSFDSETSLNKIDKRLLMSVGKNQDMAWIYRRTYSTKDEILSYVTKARDKSTLDSFLIKSFTPREIGDFMIMDYSHYFIIDFYEHSDTITYEANLINKNFCGQPFINRSIDTDDFYLNDKNSVYNLDINRLLLKMLPDFMKARNSFLIDGFLKPYIRWYNETL